MPQPGSPLSIDCRIRDGRIEAVAIGPRFLPPLPALLRGKTPSEAMARVSALFALCRHGQCLALSRAIGQALGVPSGGDWARLLRALRDLEMLREHSLNLLRLPGWPPPEPSVPVRLLEALGGITQALAGGAGSGIFVADGTGLSVDGKALGIHRDALQTALEALLGPEWLAEEPDFEAMLRDESRLSGHLLRDLVSGAEFGQSAAAPLPIRLPETDLAEALGFSATDDFLSRPTWEGRPRETGCYARRYRHPGVRTLRSSRGHELASRFFARLLEIRALTHGLRRRLSSLALRPSIVKPCPQRSGGFGVGQVQTARGLLIHVVELRDGVIVDCRYVAPTEWNFHPEGLLAGLLGGLPVHDETALRRRIALLLHCIDPCVDCHLALSHSGF